MMVVQVLQIVLGVLCGISLVSIWDSYIWFPEYLKKIPKWVWLCLDILVYLLLSLLLLETF